MFLGRVALALFILALVGCRQDNGASAITPEAEETRPDAQNLDSLEDDGRELAYDLFQGVEMKQGGIVTVELETVDADASVPIAVTEFAGGGYSIIGRTISRNGMEEYDAMPDTFVQSLTAQVSGEQVVRLPPDCIRDLVNVHEDTIGISVPIEQRKVETPLGSVVGLARITFMGSYSALAYFAVIDIGDIGPASIIDKDGRVYFASRVISTYPKDTFSRLRILTVSIFPMDAYGEFGPSNQDEVPYRLTDELREMATHSRAYVYPIEAEPGR